mgnify:CR=1 FL=1
MHEDRGERALSPYQHHRREAARLRAAAIGDLSARLGVLLARGLARLRPPAAAASGPRPAPPRPSPARAAW